MGSDEKWYFTRQQLDNSPSRQCGIDSLKELSYRQQAANFIQDLGQRLKVSQLCMNTAIVYMHRFYVFHSFTHFPWSSIAAAALFLSAKVEEQPRKVEHVIKVAYLCKNHKEINFDANPEKFQVLSQDLVFNENILLQTLGFDVAIDHPHTHIVRCCHLVRAGKDLAQCAYFMASNSLHLTTMCLQYKPTVVACFCIHLACKWSRWEIPLSNEKKEWFSYIDPTVTLELLERLTEEFLITFEKCPSRLKEKIMSVGGSNMSSMIDQHNWSQNHHQQQQSNSPLETEKKPPESSEGKEAHHRPQGHVSHHHGDSKSNMHDETNKPRSSKSLNEQALSSGQPGVPLSLRDREKEYRDRKERERISGQHGSVKLPPPHPSSSSGKQPLPPHYHHKHRPPPLGSGPPPPGGRQEPRDILREASKQQARSGDKDVQKRDYVVKTNVTDVNSLSNFVPDARLKYSEKQRAEQAKGKVHDANVRRHESEAERQKHLHKSGYVSKSGVHPAQKVKPPYLPDTSKTMPKPYRPEVPHNGHSSLASSSNSSGGGGGGSVPSLTDDKYNMKQDVKEDAYVMPPVKKPSLFSPEKSPPHKKRVEMKTDFSPPNPITTSSYAPISVSQANKILKTDPEPRVNKKETLDNSECPDIPSELNKLLVPDIITPIPEPRQKPPEPSISKELKPPDLIPPFQNTTNNLPTISNTLLQSQPLANGIETDPTLISNLLKETPTVPHLPAVAATVAAATPQSAAETKDKEHHHKERKKKNKEKHKHKDKDRNREEKEKKKKHKDKDKDKHKSKDKYHQQKEEEPAPIKITIQKDKIQLPHGEPAPMVGLKIKIPKDRIKAENISEAPAPPSSGGLKIKIPIPKEVVNNFSAETNGRKRERTSPLAGPTAKLPRTSSFKYNEPKQNGRHKVSGYTVAPNNNNGRPPMPHYNQPRPPQPHHYPHPPPPPPPPQQQHFYYYPTNMNIPPNMNMNMNMNMPPPTAYMYHHQQQYYPNPGFLYTPQHAVAVAAGGGGGGGQPPLPADAPPDVPPPPPPE